MARDRYNRNIECSDCGSTGQIRAQENDGYSLMSGGPERQVISVPEGFHVISHGYKVINDPIIIGCSCGGRWQEG